MNYNILVQWITMQTVAWMMTFVCSDLEQSLRIKIQGTEKSIQYTTFCIKGDKERREERKKERERVNLYTYVGKCTDYRWRISKKLGTACAFREGNWVTEEKERDLVSCIRKPFFTYTYT